MLVIVERPTHGGLQRKNFAEMSGLSLHCCTSCAFTAPDMSEVCSFGLLSAYQNVRCHPRPFHIAFP